MQTLGFSAPRYSLELSQTSLEKNCLTKFTQPPVAIDEGVGALRKATAGSTSDENVWGAVEFSRTANQRGPRLRLTNSFMGERSAETGPFSSLEGL